MAGWDDNGSTKQELRFLEASIAAAYATPGPDAAQGEPGLSDNVDRDSQKNDSLNPLYNSPPQQRFQKEELYRIVIAALGANYRLLADALRRGSQTSTTTNGSSPKIIVPEDN